MTIAYLDTNILIDYFAGHVPAKTVMEQFDSLKLPAVTYIEFMAGLKNKQQIETADKVIHDLFEVVQTTQEICNKAANLRREKRLKLPDLMIYATSLVGGGVLVTRNTKDFQADNKTIMVPYGL